jgi:hypothetical protein
VNYRLVASAFRRKSGTGAEPKALRLESFWILLGFSALAVFWTWPAAATLTTRIPHDGGDPVLNIWILWWNAHATPFTEAWWNAPMMWPMTGVMALSEHLVGLSVVATPLQWAGVNPIAAYNVCFLLTFALSGFFAFLLGRRLTGSVFAGICAGLAFGFSPYRAGQLSHIQVLSSQWMPLALLGLHAYLDTGARRWLVVFGLAWLMQALSNGYFLLFFPVLVMAWMLWFVDWRRAPGRGLAMITAWAVASLPLLPVLLKYHEVHERLGLTRSVEEIRAFSAVPASFLHATPFMKFWRAGPGGNEQQLFTGVTVVLLASAGLVLLLARRTRRSVDVDMLDMVTTRTILFYAAATVLMWMLALGPGGEGRDPSPLHPYAWLLSLPGFNGLRAPSRFAMLGTLCLAVSAGLAVAHCTRLFANEGAGWPRRVRLLGGAAVITGLLADGLTRPVPVVTPPGKVILPGSQQAAVIELPLEHVDVSVQAMYRSIFHRQPLVNGYSGHFPPHYRALSLSLWRGDVSGLFYLARRRPLAIIVNDRLDPGGGFKQMIEEVPGIQSHGVSSAGTMFLLPPQPVPREQPPEPPLPATVRDAGRSLLEFDVGAPHRLSAIAVRIRRRYEDFASRIRIETSEDGMTWHESWVGWTGGMLVEAMLSDPLLTQVRIPLGGVRARYVRVYPAGEWMKAEIQVLGR